jgi:hypothetical protein
MTNVRAAHITEGHKSSHHHHHDDPDGLPEFLCRRCHPELNMTPERRRELDAADEEKAKRERAEARRRREIAKMESRLASISKRGEPDADSVQGKIARALRNKLARLQESIPSTQPKEPAMNALRKHSKGRSEAEARKKGKAKEKTSRTRADSKQAKLIEMLKHRDGATIEEIAKAFDWQAHTVRGAIAGALKKKLGLNVTSEKDDTRGRVYRITE